MLMYGKENLCWQTEGHFACVIQIYFQICLDNDVSLDQTFEKHVKDILPSPLLYLHRKSKSCVSL